MAKSTKAANRSDAASTLRLGSMLIYLVLGIIFGIILIKSEVVSWFRIQEMFRFQAFHMYGIIGSAIAVAALSFFTIKKLNLRDRSGEPIVIPPKKWEGIGTRYWLGGIIFGLGWALLGACPGPIFALFGAGFTVIAIAFLSAIAGTWVYGYLRPKLPH